MLPRALRPSPLSAGCGIRTIRSIETANRKVAISMNMIPSMPMNPRSAPAATGEMIPVADPTMPTIPCALP